MADDPTPTTLPPELLNKKPEEIAALYLQTTSEMEKLKQANARANAEAKERREALEKFKDFDPDRYQKLIDAEKAREQEDQLKRGEFDKLLSAKEKEARESREKAEAVQRSWDTERITAQLISAAGALKALPNVLEGGTSAQIVRVYAGELKLDATGTVVHRTKLGADGKPMGLKEFLEEEKKGLGANLFTSAMLPGTGTLPGGGDANGKVVIKRSAPDVEKQRVFEQAKKDGKQVVFVD